MGAVITLTGLVLASWHASPTALVRIDYGWPSWVLTVLAAGAAAWALRDGFAAAGRGPGKKMEANA